MDRTILHCDCNSFFASVETLLDPSLADGPTAVCGDPESRHGIILAKNEKARPSAYKLPRPSGRRNENARIYGW